MIALPSEIGQAQADGEGNTWDGRSIDSATDIEHPNKETAMDWAEHQRIVFNARRLVTSAVPHTGEVKKAFKALKSAYEEESSRTVLRVSKGIHQPEANPHMQLKAESTFLTPGPTRDSPPVRTLSVLTFHLNVSAVDIPVTPGLAERFHWEGVQFSFLHGGTTYCWPTLAQPPTGKVRTQRRVSISSAGLAAHVAEHTRLEAVRVAKELSDSEDAAFQTLCADFEKTHGLGKLRRNQVKEGRRMDVAVPNTTRRIAFRYNKESKTIGLLP